MPVPLIPVRLKGGLVVMHTREEYERLWAGVDRQACAQMNKPIEPENSEDR